MVNRDGLRPNEKTELFHPRRADKPDDLHGPLDAGASAGFSLPAKKAVFFSVIRPDLQRIVTDPFIESIEMIFNIIDRKFCNLVNIEVFY